MDRELRTIYVYLEDEATEVWRPVEASHIKGDIYRIESVNQNTDDEKWRFTTGDTVRCESKVFSRGETGMVAVERVPEPI